MTSTAKAAQKKIDQASMDLSISRNDEREKIRQIRFSLTENERRELNDFQHGRLNNFVIGRTRNGNRNDHGYNVNFDYIYDIV
uniref:Stress response protein NST1 n=1 Tax=Rhabditophanes sp. KR3021 TaxID=114890 RepID=A0AC35TUZ4_9BILA